jgi:hypothetical protein
MKENAAIEPQPQETSFSYGARLGQSELPTSLQMAASSLNSMLARSSPRPTFRGLTATGRRSGSHVVGCSRQFGRASAPTIPHRVHTMRGPNIGTTTSSDHGSALMIARWWHC